MALGNYPVHLSELAGYSKEELSTMLVEFSRSNARMKDEIASLNQNLQNAVIYQQQREANFGLIVRSFEYTLQFRDQWIRELRAERWKQQCRLDELCVVAAFSSDDESQDDDEYLNIHKRRKMMEEHHQSSNDEAIHSTVGKESEDEEDVVHHEREKENEVEQEVEEVENEVDIEEEEDDEVEEDEEEVVEVEEDEEDEEEVVEVEEDEEEVVEVEEDEEDEEDEDEEEEEEEEEIQIHGYGICHKEVVVPMLRDISHIKDLVKSGTNFPNLKDCLLNCFTYYGLYLKFPFFCDQKSRTANEKNQTISNTRYYSCCCCRSRLFFVTIPKKEAGCTLTLLSERKHECDIEDLYTNYRDYYTNKKKAST